VGSVLPPPEIVVDPADTGVEAVPVPAPELCSGLCDTVPSAGLVAVFPGTRIAGTGAGAGAGAGTGAGTGAGAGAGITITVSYDGKVTIAPVAVRPGT
jgi:hypothetical protein